MAQFEIDVETPRYLRDKVRLLPPEKFRDLVLSKPENKAVGLKAVKEAIAHLQREMGMGKGLRLIAKMNQQDGFDCSGCAWPDPEDHRSNLGEYCENGAKALAEEATDARVDPAFFREHSVEELSLWPDFELGKAGRITQPMVLRKGKINYEPISWDDAFVMIGNHLNALASPNQAIFYTSGRTSNEAAFMYQLFVRAYGTNNLPDCSNMCHESSGTALGATLGIGKGSVKLEDLYIADVIVVIGQNPGTNHPRMLGALKKCKDNGGTIIDINPLEEAGLQRFVDPQKPMELLKGGTYLADMHLPVRINGDVPLLKGIIRLLWEMDLKAPGKVFDMAFIQANTQDFDAFLEDVKKTDLAICEKESGIPRAMMEKVARILGNKKKIIFCWAMGLTQHVNAVGNIQEIVNIILLRGAIGKPGAGTCPVRGHSNVQGDRTMGIFEKPREWFLAALDKEFEIHSPRPDGYDTVEAIHAMLEGKAKVFIAMGGNFISATPDSEATAKSLQKCTLTVQISTKLNRSHVITGEEALILPCIARSEADTQKAGIQFISVENSMGVVSKSQGSAEPASKHLLSEPAIVAGMAKATLSSSPLLDWDVMVANYDRIREHIEAVIPGFEDFNQRVRQPNGFYLPNGPREGKFPTPSGKAHFTVNPIPKNPLQPGQFALMTIRTHDQYNTTIYGLNDRYRGIHNERRVILMNTDDMHTLGLHTRDMVDLTSHFRGEKRHARGFIVVPYKIPKGCMATYFPEANVLVPLDNVAEKSNTPVSKFIPITVHKSQLKAQ
jgi:molybdopterin-dependent oxidoreductase alpha subunit